MSWLSLSRFGASLWRTRKSHPATPRRPTCRPVLETLEDRLCPSGGYLLVSSQDNASVMRYDERTGGFVDTFLPKGSGGLTAPGGLILGPADHNLYVSSGVFPSNQPNHQVL